MLDYGAGNVRSLINAVNRLGYEIEYIKDPSDFAKAEVLLSFVPCISVEDLS